ncbi:MAG: hypothetical protein JKX73_05925 [Flavobacteriales bacterium]|nr:hypothetical protein [Flavobacteriales bacterium]
MRTLLFFGLIIVATSSCKQINVDQEIAQIDSLKTIITTAQTIIEEVDIDQVKTISEQMSNQIMLAKSLYGDSIAWEKAKLISKYHGVNKAFGKYIEKQRYLMHELSFSQEQLQDLGADLQNNIITSDSFNIYFDKECKAVTELRELIQREVDKAKTNMKGYEESSSEIQRMLEEQDVN